MDIFTQICLLILSIFIIRFIFIIPDQLQKILNYLKKIKLLLEISSPIFSSEGLWQLEQEIEYWKEKDDKYHNDFSDKNKKIKDLISGIYWDHRRELEIFKEMNLKALCGKSLKKVREEYDKELDEIRKRINENEEKLRKPNKKINDELMKRDLDYEFLGRWTREKD